jgi:hypothetical protein
MYIQSKLYGIASVSKEALNIISRNRIKAFKKKCVWISWAQKHNALLLGPLNSSYGSTASVDGTSPQLVDSRVSMVEESNSACRCHKRWDIWYTKPIGQLLFSDHVQGLHWTMNAGIIHQDNTISIRKGVHSVEQATNKLTKGNCLKRTLNNVCMQNSIMTDGRKDRISMMLISAYIEW